MDAKKHDTAPNGYLSSQTKFHSNITLVWHIKSIQNRTGRIRYVVYSTQFIFVYEASNCMYFWLGERQDTPKQKYRLRFLLLTHDNKKKNLQFVFLCAHGTYR